MTTRGAFRRRAGGHCIGDVRSLTTSQTLPTTRSTTMKVDSSGQPTACGIYTAIPKVMQAVGAVAKDRRNEQQRYKFRGIDDILNACQKPMLEAGVFCVPAVTDHKREERESKSGGMLVYTIL